MKQVYGDKYDAKTAEQLRQKALAGDFSFLPDVKFVSRDTLQGGNGAYSAKEGVVYIAEDLKNDPALMKSTFVEEAGHKIDTLINKTDAQGDEGELFRRILSGEKLSKSDIASIKAEDDHGTIYVNGKAQDVEFWNPIKSIKKAAKAVGKAFVTVSQGFGTGMRDLFTHPLRYVKGFGAGLKALGTKAWHGIAAAGKAVGGFFKNVGLGFGHLFGHPLETIKDFGRGLKGLASKAWDGLKFLGGKIGAGFKKVGEGFEWLGGKIKDGVVAGAKAVGGFFKNVGLGFGHLFSHPLEAIKGFGKGLKGLGSKAWDGLKFLGGKIGAAGAWLGGKAYDGTAKVLTTMWDYSFGPAIKAVKANFGSNN